MKDKIEKFKEMWQELDQDLDIMGEWPIYLWVLFIFVIAPYMGYFIGWVVHGIGSLLV